MEKKSECIPNFSKLFWHTQIRDVSASLNSRYNKIIQCLTLSKHVSQITETITRHVA